MVSSAVVLGIFGYVFFLLGTLVFETLLPRSEAGARSVQNAICTQWFRIFVPVFIGYLVWVLTKGTAQKTVAGIEQLMRKTLTLRNIGRAAIASVGGFIAEVLLWIGVGALLDRAQLTHALRNG